jgi:hypothetical protein
MKCIYNDCGWCYCDDIDKNSNDECGACKDPDNCPAHTVKVTSIADHRRKLAIQSITVRTEELDW